MVDQNISMGIEPPKNENVNKSFSKIGAKVNMECQTDLQMDTIYRYEM